MSDIKIGVTLYCFTREYCRGELTLEDCIRIAKEIGAEGYEIVATQMIPSYPCNSNQFLGKSGQCRNITISNPFVIPPIWIGD